MKKERPNILTIAGFDSSSGAGLTSDIKTYERLRCYGLAVQTANTIQTDREFTACVWIDKATILLQLETLLKRFSIAVVKIGIVQNWEVLLEIIQCIKRYAPEAKIIVDPILKSSTKFQFHHDNTMLFDKILEQIDLLTPNYQEIKTLYADKSIAATITHIASKTNLFLKGGHRTDKKGQDQLFTNSGKQFVINPKKGSLIPKHGSGCVLSSAIASYLALGFPLLKSCVKGKRYVEKFLASNNTALGFHL